MDHSIMDNSIDHSSLETFSQQRFFFKVPKYYLNLCMIQTYMHARMGSTPFRKSEAHNTLSESHCHSKNPAQLRKFHILIFFHKNNAPQWRNTEQDIRNESHMIINSTKLSNHKISGSAWSSKINKNSYIDFLGKVDYRGIEQVDTFR